jgi:hypothetical protein
MDPANEERAVAGLVVNEPLDCYFCGRKATAAVQLDDVTLAICEPCTDGGDAALYQHIKQTQPGAIRLLMLVQPPD